MSDCDTIDRLGKFRKRVKAALLAWNGRDEQGEMTESCSTTSQLVIEIHEALEESGVVMPKRAQLLGRKL